MIFFSLFNLTFPDQLDLINVFELSSRIKTFENILIFIQQYWLHSQVQLKYSEFGTFLIEKVEIENDTTDIVFPENQEHSQIHISSETSLKGHKYEAMLIKGNFLKFIYHDLALASGIVYFQFNSEMLNYKVNLDFELRIKGEKTNNNTYCMTLSAVSDHDYEWDSKSCKIKEVSDDNLKCSCQDGKRLQNFGGFVSSVDVSDSETTTTTMTTTSTTTTTALISSTSTTTTNFTSTTPAPCEVGKDKTVFTVVYATLSISLIFSAAIFFAVLFATRYKVSMCCMIS